MAIMAIRQQWPSCPIPAAIELVDGNEGVDSDTSKTGRFLRHTRNGIGQPHSGLKIRMIFSRYWVYADVAYAL